MQYLKPGTDGRKPCVLKIYGIPVQAVVLACLCVRSIAFPFLWMMRGSISHESIKHNVFPAEGANKFDTA